MAAPGSSCPGAMRLTGYMLSCPQRSEVRWQTLANLARTDWGANPRVIVDESDHADRRVRQIVTCYRLLQEALADPSWDYLLFLEDDLDFNLHLRHNLLSWWPLLRNKVQLASLYNPGVRFLAAGKACAAADPGTVFGSQALLIARSCALHLHEHYEEAIGMQDLRFSRLAAARGPIYYHTPSLVQHIGHHSVWGGPFHQATDFDREFRA